MNRQHSPFARVFFASGAAAAALFSVSPAVASDWRDAHEVCCADWRMERGAELTESADLRWDEKTGRDARNYPPDRLADYTRMALEIDIPDMNVRRFDATQRLSFVPVGASLTALRLNAPGLEIHGVQMKGRPVEFSHDGEALTVRFEPALPVGQEATIVTRYTLQDPVDGLFWTLETPLLPGRSSEIHTQGQTETNRYWFPCHDFPNEMLHTEMTVTVPEGYLVSGNGDLVSQQTRNGRTTFHWRLGQPHVNYLVSLIVGEFDVVDVARPGDTVRLPVYVPPGRAADVERTYGRTRDMLRVFEERYGVPYPWGERYAQLVVRNFGAGGMENTGATTMYGTAILDEKAIQDGDIEGLIAHELAHQWYGDMITCKSWEHIWLNEGFATYGSALWFEARDGYDAGYLASIYRSARGVASGDRLDPKDPNAGERAAMVSKEYEHSFETFRRRSNPYPKGASILHMLRMRFGDDLFFKGIQEYTRRHQFQSVETDQFRRVMEEVTGRDLEQFFEQWCYRPGTPEVTMNASWNSADSALTIVVEQTQRIDARTPAFAFSLPVHVYVGDELTVVDVDVREKRHERVVTLRAEPTMVVLDPSLSVLMTPTYKVAPKWLIAQLRSGPTIVARQDATRALRSHAGPKTTEALAAALGDTTEHHQVRSEAARSLGELRASDELLAALRRGVDDARVRRAVMGALGEVGGTNAADALVAHASDANESYAVRGAALDALGRLRDPAHTPVVLAAVNVESQHDDVRQSALRALGRMEAEEGLAIVMDHLGAGTNSRTRAVAAGATADLSSFDGRASAEALDVLMYDHAERVRNAAVNALGRVKHERALELLNRAAQTHPHPEMRKRAERAANRVAGLLRGEEIDTLRTELGRLSREIERLREAVDAKADKAEPEND